jgi:hypothetical protein
MNWPYRLIIIVPASAVAQANALAATIDYGNLEGAPAFAAPLSATGDDPATHYSVYTSATDEMVSMMAQALPAVEGAMFWRHAADGTLVASNVTEPAGQQWGWTQSLEAAGLRRIEPQSIDG